MIVDVFLIKAKDTSHILLLSKLDKMRNGHMCELLDDVFFSVIAPDVFLTRNIEQNQVKWVRRNTVLPDFTYFDFV